jgi:hypothetical protein
MTSWICSEGGRLDSAAQELKSTGVGTKGKESTQPVDVAKQGIDALLDGKDHVYGAS